MPKQTKVEKENNALIALRIMHVFSIYPALSPTMIQAGVGPHTKSRDWKPVLEQLIAEGKLERQAVTKTSPFKHVLNYTIVSVPGFKHPSA